MCGPAATSFLVGSGRGSRSVDLEPVGTLPSGFLAEARSQLLEARIGGGEAQRPAGLPLLVGIVEVVIGGVDLDRPCQGVGAAAIGRAEAPKVHLPEIERRLAVEN